MQKALKEERRKMQETTKKTNLKMQGQKLKISRRNYWMYKKHVERSKRRNGQQEMRWKKKELSEAQKVLEEVKSKMKWKTQWIMLEI